MGKRHDLGRGGLQAFIPRGILRMSLEKLSPRIVGKLKDMARLSFYRITGRADKPTVAFETNEDAFCAGYMMGAADTIKELTDKGVVHESH